MTVSTPVQQHIRILDAQGLSWRRIAREVGVSRQTVRKYAELEDCSPKPPVTDGGEVEAGSVQARDRQVASGLCFSKLASAL